MIYPLATVPATINREEFSCVPGLEVENWEV